MTDRLSLIDASFLERETPNSPLQTGGLGVFAPGLAFADVLRTMEARLHRLPRARQILHSSPFGGGRPLWVDDTNFDLSYHLRHAALPAPGHPGQLAEFLARLMARPLDRSRPLWELYVVEGLEGGRTGLFRKIHLAMAGGAGDPLSVLIDEEADPEPDPPAAAWRPRPAPGSVELAADSARERIRQVARLGRELTDLAQTPRRVLSVGAQAAEAAAGMALRAVGGRPHSPLNTDLSPHRRFATVRIDFDDLRQIRRAFGGTINDAVVAIVGDAVGRLLRWRGHETKDLDLRVMVPVRVHSSPESGPLGMEDELGVGDATSSMGEGVVGVIAPLPVMDMDPVARLYRIMGEFAGLKESRQAVAAENLVRMAGYAPPNLHALAARAASAEEQYTVALSNAPGPQEPRYLAGVAMEESYPFIPLTGTAALSVAVSSYAGGVFFGLLGERGAMPDLDELSGFVRDACAELRDAADEVSA